MKVGGMEDWRREKREEVGEVGRGGDEGVASEEEEEESGTGAGRVDVDEEVEVEGPAVEDDASGSVESDVASRVVSVVDVVVVEDVGVDSETVSLLSSCCACATYPPISFLAASSADWLYTHIYHISQLSSLLIIQWVEAYLLAEPAPELSQLAHHLGHLLVQALFEARLLLLSGR